MLGREFKEIMKKEVSGKTNGLQVKMTLKIFYSDTKGLVITGLSEWDKNQDRKKINSFVSDMVESARKGAGKVHEFYNGFKTFLMYEDIHNTNIDVPSLLKIEDVARQYGYLEFERQYLLEEKKVRLFLNSKPYFEATVRDLTKEDIQDIKEDWIKDFQKNY